MEAIGTAASVVGLIGSAITLIQQIRNAQGRVRGASNALANLSKQLESLERSLSLVREEEALQTAAVGQQVQGITEVAEELQSFLDKLATEQRKRSISQVIHAIKSGDKEDKQLADILDRLDRARDLLVLQISVAQVGVTGNLRDGFRVALGVLMETNKKVNEILGTNLVLAEQLKDRALQQTDDTIALDRTDAETLGLLDQKSATTSGSAATDIDGTLIYDNITLGQARIMTGNVGVENWRKTAGRKTTIASNKFERDVRIMTGDQGGDAAKGFNENFWK